ncbi:MAG: ATP-binding cassette domain-containing protein [Oscillospiraceae bacterium]|nr:ATP-binding cassette domain-containing protein [Oscillospiraceae bacterium]
MKLKNITKTYPTDSGEKRVLDNYSLELPNSGAVWIMGESGCGKTTLLRIIAGLESFEGSIEDIPPGGVSMVFQEDRLFEELSPEDNCLLALNSHSERHCDSRSEKRSERRRNERQHIRQMLVATGIPEEDMTRPVRGFSGGMKRRTAIVRALCVPSGLVLMDEPFTGIDPENRLATGKVIRESLGDRLFIGVTHHKEDCELLKGEIVQL